MAEITSIVYKPKPTPERPATYLRVPLETATLVAGYGIEGDRKRQLNIMSYETMEVLRAEGFQATPGELGEQIVVRGLDVEALPRGARFRLGESAVVEVTGLREPCARFEAAQNRPMSAAEGRIGVIARVITGGSIRIGDPVALAEAIP